MSRARKRMDAVLPVIVGVGRVCCTNRYCRVAGRLLDELRAVMVPGAVVICTGEGDEADKRATRPLAHEGCAALHVDDTVLGGLVSARGQLALASGEVRPRTQTAPAHGSHVRDARLASVRPFWTRGRWS
eukprot:1159539-Prymnesium_polylepis.3